MITKKEIMDILACPYLYTKKKRREAVKGAIKILDNIAEAENESGVAHYTRSSGDCDKCGKFHPGQDCDGYYL